ncbi:MAG: hypothetical protein IJ461_06770 [Clostridia bacterium]|nr:hypothetical protein [Clostridia bacterium]
MTELLGLPLDRALQILDQRGLPRPQVVITASPKSAREAGTLRVVAVNSGCLTAARFLDGMPEEQQAQM